ncbi:unnamed protein product [Closterium sp. Naga37s-1]|nr:unnamed protein product [Closterium sp. Naga37s-1]
MGVMILLHVRARDETAERERIVLGRLSRPLLVRLHGYCIERLRHITLLFHHPAPTSPCSHLTLLPPHPAPTSPGSHLTLLPPHPALATPACALQREREVIVLGRLSHPLLVHLHGYCMEGNEALLVYEFMPGGSLDKALLDSAKGELFFSWDMRLKVAVQVAEALTYMHALNIIHRDLKAANVLLSPEYDAKLTDFGMVRVGPDRQLRSIVSTRLMGTQGYIDPSYMETGHLGPKSDVYSFGVLMFELVTGRTVAEGAERVVNEGQRITVAGKSARVVAVPASRIVATAASNPDAVSASKRSFLKKTLGAAAVGLPPLVLGGKAMAEGEQQAVASSRMSYSRFLEYLDMDRVKKVDLYENGTIAIVEAVSPELGNRIQRVRVQLPGLSGELLAKFRENNIDFAAHNPQEDSGAVFMNVLGNLAFPLLLVGGLFLLSRRSQGMGPGGPGGPMAFGQSKAKFQMEPNTGVTFNDVAGVDEAKQDFMEVVEFLKRPERFTAVGARIPKGVLLVGPPGTGKTLLAKAIAGEAAVPFFSISGSEFVEMFVGVGASRVRDLFKKAKENAPCIVFVDEIDAVGRQRGTGIGGGNDEREQTLNQLLTEMDGFEGNTGVIVIAATNRADILDAALLRPGRFDRQVSVDVPDIKGRKEILKVHASNKKFADDVNLDVVAARTPGFSGADLANLLNEAAILTGRRGKTAISSKEIDDAIDRIVAGLEGTVMTDGKSKSLVAYHEVGHAICGTLTPGHDAVQKVTLVPRGQARGLTWFIPNDDPSLISKQQIFARIVGALGGRAAEEVVFGDAEVTTGASSDLQQVTGMAKQMVTVFGMSDIGPWALMDPAGQGGDVIMRMMARNSMSEKLAEDIDAAVKSISDEAYEVALAHIRNNREAIDKIVEVLVEKETLSGDEFRAILSEFTEIPKENMNFTPITA